MQETGDANYPSESAVAFQPNVAKQGRGTDDVVDFGVTASLAPGVFTPARGGADLSPGGVAKPCEGVGTVGRTDEPISMTAHTQSPSSRRDPAVVMEPIAEAGSEGGAGPAPRSDEVL